MNLPHAPVPWITVQEHFNDLVLATYGRGFWILDDLLTPLQQLTPVRTSAAHLFQPSGVPLSVTRGAGGPPGRGRHGPEPAWGYRDQAAWRAGHGSHRHYDQRHRRTYSPRVAAQGRAASTACGRDLRYDTPSRRTLSTPPPGHDHVPVPPEGRPFFAWRTPHARAWAGESRPRRSRRPPSSSRPGPTKRQQTLP